MTSSDYQGEICSGGYHEVVNSPHGERMKEEDA